METIDAQIVNKFSSTMEDKFTLIEKRPSIYNVRANEIGLNTVRVI